MIFAKHDPHVSAAFSLALLAASMLTLAYSETAHAEKADRNKPIEINAASGTSDLANNVQVLEGNVVLVQGTMRLTAERMRVKRDQQDHMFAELFGAGASKDAKAGGNTKDGTGGQITFREKREGFDDYMDGVADRAEFDDKTNTVKLFGRAKLRNGGDELTGEYIYYNSLTEVIQALSRAPTAGDKAPASAGGSTNSRVRIVIQPRQSEPRQGEPRESESSAGKKPSSAGAGANK
jgi:lipopolysaccharide export system protein LptA